MGAVLEKLSHRDIEEMNMQTDAATDMENRIAMASRHSTEFDTQDLGPASAYTCPDCNGSLVALGGSSFRCRVGHAWTRDALLAARDDEVDNALWVAMRSLEEKAMATQLADTIDHGLLFERYIVSLTEEAEGALSVLSQRLSASGTRTSGAGG